MAKFTQQQLDAQYQKLPRELQDAFLDVNAFNKIFDIGKKHKLTIEEIGFAAEEIAYIILGLLSPGDFIKSLAERLNLEEDEINPLGQDINQQIFLPLREALKKAHQIEIAVETPKSAEPVATKTPPAPITPPPAASATVIPQEEVEKIKEEFKRRPFVQPVPAEKFSQTPPPPAPPRPIEPPSKMPAPAPKPEPIAPVTAPKPKISPIDLRQGAKPRTIPPEMMRGAIFAPPTKKTTEPITAPVLSEPETVTAPPPENKAPELKPEAKPLDKKPLTRSFDPYREPME